VKLTARNAAGAPTRDFRIVVGSTLALTPPMGRSTWICARTKISDRYIRTQADAMVSSGAFPKNFRTDVFRAPAWTR
jgi:alpha-galactosidase